MDLVNHPDHYTRGKYEVLEVILDWELNHLLGSVVKYIGRVDKKPGADPIEDLEKAEFYLKKEISRRKQLKMDEILLKPKSRSGTQETP